MGLVGTNDGGSARVLADFAPIAVELWKADRAVTGGPYRGLCVSSVKSFPLPVGHRLLTPDRRHERTTH